MKRPKKRIRRSFKNKADATEYLLHPREIERYTLKDGTTYCIWDDGNYASFHIFSIEKYNARWESWVRVSDTFINYIDAYKELKKLLATEKSPLNSVEGARNTGIENYTK